MRNVLLATLLLLLFTGCEENKKTAQTISEASFTLEDASLAHYTVIKKGRNVTIKEAPKKVILFDIFATWCPSCKVVAPHLSNIQKTYGDDVLVMGIMIEDNKPHSYSQAFAKEYGVTYPISNARDNRILAARIAADMRQPRSFPIPLLVMYDQNGEYYRHYVGAVPEEMIARDVENLLAK